MPYSTLVVLDKWFNGRETVGRITQRAVESIFFFPPTKDEQKAKQTRARQRPKSTFLTINIFLLFSYKAVSERKETPKDYHRNLCRRLGKLKKKSFCWLHFLYLFGGLLNQSERAKKVDIPWWVWNFDPWGRLRRRSSSRAKWWRQYISFPSKSSHGPPTKSLSHVVARKFFFPHLVTSSPFGCLHSSCTPQSIYNADVCLNQNEIVTERW